MARIEVDHRPERLRRVDRRTEARDAAVSQEPGAAVADVVRPAEADQIYRWRQQFARSDGFAAGVDRAAPRRLRQQSRIRRQVPSRWLSRKPRLACGSSLTAPARPAARTEP